MTILVTGATGNVGRLVVRGLAGRAEVRAVSRKPATGTVYGDLDDPDSIPFDGVERLYLFAYPPTAQEVVDRAVKAGVRRIVTLSSGAVTYGYDTSHHLPVEQAVEASGAEWTHLRPGIAAANKIDLWGAAYLINGGCSDDGFDYFRGWLIAQGREVFERTVADPDALAELPVVQGASAGGPDLDGEDVLSIAWDAHVRATGVQLPADAFTIRYPEPAPGWDFDFDDRAEMTRRLPRLSALRLE